MEKTINKKERVDWIDSLKGLAIILVVLGHVLDGYFNNYNSLMLNLYKFIYLFL